MTYDLIVKGGLLPDGTQADIAISKRWPPKPSPTVCKAALQAAT